ncbi:MAG: DUF4157 domain-containing protein [Leptolyngbyaceae cyanobacterium SM2_5_2]|nr:DUF4157 domain-containing protein [Leptolyngbyaceae cyanobacterium SM2_5_2]
MLTLPIYKVGGALMGNQRLAQVHAPAQKEDSSLTFQAGHNHPADSLESIQQLTSNRAVNRAILQRAAGLQPRQKARHSNLNFRGLSSELSPSPHSQNVVIHPKLVIGQPNDPYEQEADRVAKQVVQNLNLPSTIQTDAAPTLQREVMPEEEEDYLQMKPMPQPQQGTVEATPALEQSIQQMRGGGQPLPNPIREPMEQAFGADFSGVRVHANNQADKLARSISAKAFTAGQDVFFKEGTYTPYHQDGQELLAHELTHVVQQNSSKAKKNLANQITLDNIGIAPEDKIQRKLMSLTDLERVAGVRISSWPARGIFNEIAKKVEQYELIDRTNLPERLLLLTEIEKLIVKWREAKETKKKQTNKDSSKRIALRELANSIHDEKKVPLMHI